ERRLRLCRCSVRLVDNAGPSAPLGVLAHGPAHDSGRRGAVRPRDDGQRRSRAVLSPRRLLCRRGTHLFGPADELGVLRKSHVLRAAAAALRTARLGTCAPRGCGTGCHALSWPVALGGRKPAGQDPRAWKAFSFPARCPDRDRTLRPDPARVAPAADLLRCHAEQRALQSDELVHRAGRLAVLASDARSAAPPAFAPAPAAPLLLPLPGHAAHDPGLSGPRVLAEQLVSGLLGVRTVPAD